MADNVEQCDGRTLQKLIERGSMTLREIMEPAEIDQFAMPVAQSWVDSALAARLDRGDGLEGVNSISRHRRWAGRGPRFYGTLRQ